jgi:molecular chaperone HscB
MNYFELFEIPVSPKVDVSVLQKRYLELQRASHPDYYTQADEHERMEMEHRTAQINQAMQVFRDPLKTLGYFLSINGIITEQETAALPPEFLMEMMELNEQWEDGDKDGVQKQIETLQASWEEEFAGALSNPAMNMEKLQLLFFQKKYLNRLLDRMKD